MPREISMLLVLSTSLRRSSSYSVVNGEHWRGRLAAHRFGTGLSAAPASQRLLKHWGWCEPNLSHAVLG